MKPRLRATSNASTTPPAAATRGVDRACRELPEPDGGTVRRFLTAESADAARVDATIGLL
ncbi:hypothetical protein Aab01nite_74000 [Paractinoplanes abujensis]|nr:hypothetical protein Aab01nite_74000 [Actinoplanes abujensis]